MSLVWLPVNSPYFIIFYGNNIMTYTYVIYIHFLRNRTAVKNEGYLYMFMMQHDIALMFFPETRSGRSAVCTLPHLRTKITFSEICLQVVCANLMTAGEKEKLRITYR